MSAPFRVVAARPLIETAPSAPVAVSLSERIRELQAEAKGLAREHIGALEASLLETQRLAEEIARGGDIYPPGVRDLAQRLGEDSAAKALTIEAIMARI